MLLKLWLLEKSAGLLANQSREIGPKPLEGLLLEAKANILAACVAITCWEDSRQKREKGSEQKINQIHKKVFEKPFSFLVAFRNEFKCLY